MNGLRNTGIAAIGEVPWATHFCQFYQTKQDLIDILVPYFKAGLESNEFCMLVTAEPLTAEEAGDALAKAVPGFAEYQGKGQIEILRYTEWHAKGGSFDGKRLLSGWVEKLESAVARGFDGMRVTGNTSWLEKENGKSFANYEAEVNTVIGKHKMLALCTYSLDKCNAIETIDVLRNHEFALIRQDGKWERIENAAFQSTKEALAESQGRLRQLYLSMSEGICLHEILYDDLGRAVDYVITDVNPAFESITGLVREQAIRQRASKLYGAGEAPYLDVYARVASTGESAFFETYFPPMGKHFRISAFSPERGKFVTVFSDITEHKQAEEALRQARYELETRVQERTEELRKANEVLQVEIAERRKAEEAIKAERQRFNDVLEMLPAYVVLLAPDYHVPFANRFFRERFGESHGKRCFEYLFERAEPCEICETYTVMKTNAPHHWEWTGPDGRNYDIFDFPFSDTDGSPLIMEMGIDITERKKAEEALCEARDELETRVQERTEELRESEERYRNIVETANEGILVLDLAGIITFANQIMADLLGRTREELLGRVAMDLMEAGQDTEVLSARAELKEGARIQREFRYRRKDGSILWTNSSASPLLDGQGCHFANLVMCTDITERKRAEETQRLAAREWQTTFDSIPDMISIQDKDSKIIRVNKAFADAAKMSSEELKGRQCFAVIHGTACPIEGCPHQETLRTGKTVSRDIFEPRLGIYLEVTTSPIFNEAGELSGSVHVAKDITERKKAEEALRESEERLKRAQEIGHLGSWELNLLSNRLTWSDEVYRIFGLQPQEFSATYEAFLERVHPDDRTAVDSAYSSSLRDNRSTYEIEHRAVRKDTGEIRFVHEKCEHFRDATGKIIRSVGMVHDITERKQSEETTRALAEQYSTILFTTSDGFWLMDAKGRLLDVNDAYCRMSGYSREELLGLSVSDLEATEKADETAQHMERIIESGSDRFESRHRAKDGHLLDIEVSTTFMGTKGWFIVFIHDISERKQAEEQLRETRDYLNNLLDSANAPIIVWDPDFRITRFNHAFEHLTGLKAEQVLGKKLEILFPEDQRKESLSHISHISRTLAGERWEVVEIPILHTDGKVRTVLWNSANIHGPDVAEVIATIAQGQDITDRKRAEGEVRSLNEALNLRAMALEIVNKELEGFSYSVSHDLRAPLRSMDGFSLALLEDYGDKLDDQGRDYLQRIRASSQLMEQLIDGILKLSRVTRSPISLREVNLSEITHSIAVRLEKGEPQRAAQFLISPDIVVNGDAQLLQLVMENLIENAWKFTARQPQARIEFGVEERDCGTTCFIRDNGAGFDPTYASKLFMPFQRLHSVAEFPGTGIGLATVQRIISRHGGRIWAQGEVGKGATFYFTLRDTAADVRDSNDK